MQMHHRIRPQRRIAGSAAVLLPFTAAGAVDWDGFERLVAHTVAAGLTPAVNMDTGFGPVLPQADQAEVLRRTAALAPAGFIAGVHVIDRAGDPLDVDAYRREAAAVAAAGATPITFPSYGLATVPDASLGEVFQAITTDLDRLLAFELGGMFHPAGRIWSIDGFAAVMDVPRVVGLKHSSLDRALEWERLAVRDARRPDFRFMTGNDLAIDMVTYGSDYLLGLAAFAPDAFGARDRAWLDGDEVRFRAIDDLLQHLGRVAFRRPVPGYRHDAAMFLAMRGAISSDATHPSSPVRPAGDRELLAQILEDLRAIDALDW